MNTAPGTTIRRLVLSGSNRPAPTQASAAEDPDHPNAAAAMVGQTIGKLKDAFTDREEAHGPAGRLTERVISGRGTHGLLHGDRYARSGPFNTVKRPQAGARC